MIHWREQSGNLKIAALTVIDRLVVTLHRAGVAPITIVKSGNPPALPRATALGIATACVSIAPARTTDTLVAAADVLVQVRDVRTLLQQGGRLTTAAGQPLSLTVLPAGPETTAESSCPRLRATGVAVNVQDPASARAAERALWASLTSSSDGLVDRVFNRPCGRWLSKVLIHTPASPNTVSLASIIIGVVAAGFFAQGSHHAVLLAAILFQLSAIVDCVDGDLARVLFKESPLGKWLDLAGDQVVHVSVFAGIAAGLFRTHQVSGAFWLGASAVLGALLSFAIVLRGMRRPAGDENRRLQKLIDAATNRDFSVLVLLLAGINRLEWFLWMAAVGSHVFWITALLLQTGPRTEERPAS